MPNIKGQLNNEIDGANGDKVFKMIKFDMIISFNDDDFISVQQMHKTPCCKNHIPLQLQQTSFHHDLKATSTDGSRGQQSIWSKMFSPQVL